MVAGKAWDVFLFGRNFHSTVQALFFSLPHVCRVNDWQVFCPSGFAHFGLNPVNRPPPRRRLTLNWCHLIDTSDMQIVPVWGKRLHFASGFDTANRFEYRRSQIALATPTCSHIDRVHSFLVCVWPGNQWECTCKYCMDCPLHHVANFCH